MRVSKLHILLHFIVSHFEFLIENPRAKNHPKNEQFVFAKYKCLILVYLHIVIQEE